MDKDLIYKKHVKLLNQVSCLEKTQNKIKEITATKKIFSNILNFQFLNQINIVTSNKKFFCSENLMNIEENELNYFILFFNFKYLSFFFFSMMIKLLKFSKISKSRDYWLEYLNFTNYF